MTFCLLYFVISHISFFSIVALLYMYLYLSVSLCVLCAMVHF